MTDTRVPLAVCDDWIATGRAFPAPSGRDEAVDTRAGADQVTPPSVDAVKYTSNASCPCASRVSYHMTPTAPSLFTAIAGWNCDTAARDSATMSLGALQVFPWSADQRNT